jgi:hypothetical protein
MASSGWQDAVGTLARERELAEGGARLLKAHAAGEAAAMTRGEQLYSKAKAASDELVERLLMAVQEGDDPGRSTSLQQATSEAVERRLAFTRYVEEHLPRAEGTRAAEVAGWLDMLNPVKVGAEAVKSLAEATSVLWKMWHEGWELRRAAVSTRIGAQRWRAFGTVMEEVQ